MDYNISNYGYIETQNNAAVIAVSDFWNVPLNKAALIRHKYYNNLMIQNRSPFCSLKVRIDGDRGDRFLMIPPGANIVVSGHNFHRLDIYNMDATTQIQVDQVSVTVQKDMNRLAYFLHAKKELRGEIIV